MAESKFRLIVLLFLVFNLSTAQEGALDSSFGNQGTTRIAFSDKDTRGMQMLRMDDNSVILAVNSEIHVNGSVKSRGFYIYRIFDDGTLDNGFGNNGSLYFPNNNNERSYFFSMLLQSDGKIVIIGTIAEESKLIRITQDGTFDPLFGNGGIQDIEGGYNIAQQSNGKIVVQSQFFDGYNNKYSFSRRNPDGSLDTSFGINGTQITDVTFYRYDICYTIKIDPADRILAAGASYNNGYDNHPVIARFNVNGSLDPSFGTNGTLITTFGPGSNLGEIDAIALFNDKIILGGNYQYQGGTGGFSGIKPAVAKLNKNGVLDQSFGQGGKVIMDTHYNANDMLRSITVQRDGKILLGGGASYPFPYMQTDFFVTKLNEDGSIYTNFGQNGTFIARFGGSDTNLVEDMALQPDNKVLVFGTTTAAFRNAIVCRLDNEYLNTEDFILENEILLFPNPTSSFVQIKSGPSVSRIEIYNAIGQFLDSQSFHNSQQNIEYNMQKLQNGIYTFLIYSENRVLTPKRVIKQ